MEIRFYIDPETGLPHIYKHGVKEEEVEQVLDHPGEDRPGRDDSRVALGLTSGGRTLRVVYIPDEVGNALFVVTAIPLRGNELRAYKRRMRRRRRR